MDDADEADAPQQASMPKGKRPAEPAPAPTHAFDEETGMHRAVVEGEKVVHGRIKRKEAE